ncbi:MAG: phosphoribosyltransferase family protein [Flavobacteriaceae bacterium]|jgi:pyrimidine operon attenuation protein/uracil phosphoribosyltransferase|nr:phosphoribosyltransferase [Flavobacteriaceae bacterium]|tara:strand:- start:29 stop:520 length:492 start_codon:yes stop_codon:yes gene_type:complete
MKKQVLDFEKISRICGRLAYQILENNINEDEILLVGIKEKGYEIAKIIEQKLKDITSSKVHLKSITIDKKNPNQISEFDINFNQMPKSVYLVDDVLNTGKTLMFAVNSLLKYDFDLIKTLVLIDRNHKRYPIKVDFKGISLSTNLDDTVKLISENKNLEAVLV